MNLSNSQGLSIDRKPVNPAGKTPRNRSTGLVTLALLLVVGSGLAVAGWTMAAGQKESLLAVARPIAKGQVIERDDLVTLPVSGVAKGFTTEQVGLVVGQTTTVDLVNRQILTRDMLTADPVPGKGQAMVGLSLEADRVPTGGLAAGDYVALIRTDARSGQQAIATDALVWAVTPDASATGRTSVTVIVAKAAAAEVATASVAKSVALVKTAPPAGGQ